MAFATLKQPSIGHNLLRVGRPSMYAIVFDLDQETLQKLSHGNSPNNAYADIRRFLTARGFEWKQGSTYFGDDTVDAVRCVRVVQRLAAKYDWFTPAVRKRRTLVIGRRNVYL